MLRTAFPTIDQIVDLLPPSAPPDVPDQLQDADEFAQDLLGDERRETGELYIEHDRAVAYGVADLGLDTVSIQAGLLHDTLRAQPSETIQHELLRRFPPLVYEIVTKLQEVGPQLSLDEARSPHKIEKLRRSILKTDEARVLMVRMADRVQNLLVADKMPEIKRQELARESREVYAPIANRLGVWKLKSQLEDLAFCYLEPEAHQTVADFVRQHEMDEYGLIEGHKAAIRERLAEAEITAEVSGRTKHLYSIYRKMVRKNVPVEEIYDVNAVRVIIESSEIRYCYEVLGIVHNMWKPIPEEFDDYIAKPKPNGYKSLHTAVYDETGRVLEVQIRTRAMHHEAESGVANYFVYKDYGAKVDKDFALRVAKMRGLLIDLRNEATEGSEPAEPMVNLDDLSRRIYVQTPKGDDIELVEGSTPVDFAYQVHSELGHRCRGARVNKKLVPLNYELQEGDVVEIIKGPEARPNRDWMNEDSGYAQRKNTRSKVRQWFRIHDRETNIQHGRQMLERELRLIRPKNLLTIEDVAEEFKEQVDDLLAKIGFGDIQLSQVMGTLMRLKEVKKRELETAEVLAAAEDEKIEQAVAAIVTAAPLQPQKGLVIQGLQGLHHAFANCCKPIPPEPIMGYVTRGRGVTIHSKSCEQFKTQALKEPDRIVEVSWGQTNPNATYEIPLVVRAIRMPDLAESVATIISGRRIKLVKVKGVTDKRGITTVYLVVSVTNLDDLNWLKQKLENMSQVIEVQRQK